MKLMLLVPVVVLAACSSGSDQAATTATVASSTPATSTSTSTSTTTLPTTTTVPVVALAINEMQVIGSHNSFHLKPQPVAFDAIEAVSADLAQSIEYSHRALTEQLEQFGIRQFELDVLADPEGGHYANRVANTVIGLDPLAPNPSSSCPATRFCTHRTSTTRPPV